MNHQSEINWGKTKNIFERGTNKNYIVKFVNKNSIFYIFDFLNSNSVHFNSSNCLRNKEYYLPKNNAQNYAK